PVLLAFLFNHRGRSMAASLVVYVVISLATLYYGCLFGRSINAVLMVPYLMAISLFMFNQWHLRLFCGGLAVSILVFLELNDQHQYIRSIDVTAAQATLQKWAAYTAMLFLIIA